MIEEFSYWQLAAGRIPPDILADIVNAMNAPAPIPLPRRLAQWITRPRGSAAVIQTAAEQFANDIRTMLGE